MGILSSITQPLIQKLAEKTSKGITGALGSIGSMLGSGLKNSTAGQLVTGKTNPTPVAPKMQSTISSPGPAATPPLSVALGITNPYDPKYATPAQNKPTLPVVNGQTGPWALPTAPKTTNPAPVVPQVLSDVTTSDGLKINPATGGTSDQPISPAPISPTPAPAIPAISEAYDKASKDYESNLIPTQEELDIQAQLDALNESAKTAYLNTSGQAIPLEFITGQKKSQEERALALAEPLNAKMARLQAKRTAALDASKFKMDQEQKIADRNKPVEVSGGSTLYDPVTGKPVFTAPKESTTSDQGFTLSEGQTRYDAEGNPVANSPKGSSSDAADLKGQALTSAKALLDKFKNRQGTAAVGGSSVFGIQNIPGTQSANFRIQFNNLKSLLSLDNVKLLKGQGQVSDAERRLLAEASAKLDLAQSEPEFESALTDIIKSLSGTEGQENVIQTNIGPINTNW